LDRYQQKEQVSSISALSHTPSYSGKNPSSTWHGNFQESRPENIFEKCTGVDESRESNRFHQVEIQWDQDDDGFGHQEKNWPQYNERRERPGEFNMNQNTQGINRYQNKYYDRSDSQTPQNTRTDGDYYGNQRGRQRGGRGRGRGREPNGRGGYNYNEHQGERRQQYRYQEPPNTRMYERANYDSRPTQNYNGGNPNRYNNRMTQVLDYHPTKTDFTSIARVFNSNQSQSSKISALEKDPGPSCLKREKLDELEEKHEDKMKELNYRENYQEENLLEEHRSYGNYIQKKKRNLIENFNVFKMLHEEFRFRWKLTRMHNLRQYMGDLPIYARKSDFMIDYHNYDVIIFKSNAGSGKSTQLPQYLLDCVRGGRILITEPRVIAAENVARRVQEEFYRDFENLKGNTKSIVGFVSGPRYEIHSEHTQIVYMSEVEFSY
jgi:hypothetical protein